MPIFIVGPKLPVALLRNIAAVLGNDIDLCIAYFSSKIDIKHAKTIN